MRLLRPVAAAVLLGLTALAPSAVAQAPETPAARADRLFREGKAALEANRFAEACPMLAESQRLDPGTGTLLALALCHEGNGQTATAWHEFKDVVTASQKGRADRATLASQHIHTIEPLLSTVSISVPDVLRTVIRIRIDGEEVPVLTWSSPIPVDPGDHVIEASAPGAVSWKTKVNLGASADTKVVAVPRLERVASAEPITPVAPPPAPSSPPMETRHKIGWGVGGAGALSIVVGAVFGGIALSKSGDAQKTCPNNACSTKTPGEAGAVSENQSAMTDAWVSDVLIGLGIAAGGAATYLLLTHDSPASSAPSPSPQARVVPLVGPSSAGLSFVGSW